MFVLDFTGPWWLILIDCLLAVMALLAAGHALLWKRDPRAALGWITVCLWMPLFGALAYALFGVNRIKTRALQFRDQWPMPASERARPAGLPEEMRPFAAVSDKVTRRPLVGGNLVEMLENGEEAYPAMLAAINGARRSVRLASYIFDATGPGDGFVSALAEVAARGVQVQVLVDGIGELYSRPRISGVLAQKGVEVSRFLPPRLPFPRVHLNLRNHRKILTVDGSTAFTGGMNIGLRHMVAAGNNQRRTADLHFRVRGPVVGQIEEAFLEDWAFSTGRALEARPAAAPEADGKLLCRGISDGPNEDFQSLEWILLGAISSARRTLRIMTPYFVPDRALIAALSAADMRGVEVQLILPACNNLPFVHWASRAMLWQVLERGVQVFYQPPPFHHTKYLVVDGSYAIIGSANLDARSLRLNFEFNLEVIGGEFAAVLDDHFERARSRSRELSLSEVDGRPLPVRLRDGFARLFAPYL